VTERGNQKSREKLRGLGPKSLQALARIGLDSYSSLREKGAVASYLLLKKHGGDFKPSLNLLYALVGAIEDRDWRDVARNDRERLLNELAAASEFQAQDIETGR